MGSIVSELELERQSYLKQSGLGEALLPPVRLGNCEVSLHRQEVENPTIAVLREEEDELPPWPDKIGLVWAVDVCTDGTSGQGGPLRGLLAGTRVGNEVAIYGLLPANVQAVEVLVGNGERIPVQVGQGVFVATVLADKDITVSYKDSEGVVVAEKLRPYTPGDG